MGPLTLKSHSESSCAGIWSAEQEMQTSCIGRWEAAGASGRLAGEKSDVHRRSSATHCWWNTVQVSPAWPCALARNNKEGFWFDLKPYEGWPDLPWICWFGLKNCMRGVHVSKHRCVIRSGAPGFPFKTKDFLCSPQVFKTAHVFVLAPWIPCWSAFRMNSHATFQLPACRERDWLVR